MAKSDHHIDEAAFLLCVWHSQLSRYLVHIHTLEGVSLCLGIRHIHIRRGGIIRIKVVI